MEGPSQMKSRFWMSSPLPSKNLRTLRAFSALLAGTTSNSQLHCDEGRHGHDDGAGGDGLVSLLRRWGHGFVVIVRVSELPLGFLLCYLLEEGLLPFGLLPPQLLGSLSADCGRLDLAPEDVHEETGRGHGIEGDHQESVPREQLASLALRGDEDERVYGVLDREVTEEDGRSSSEEVADEYVRCSPEEVDEAQEQRRLAPGDVGPLRDHLGLVVQPVEVHVLRQSPAEIRVVGLESVLDSPEGDDPQSQVDDHGGHDHHVGGAAPELPLALLYVQRSAHRARKDKADDWDRAQLTLP
mmetsp:Transcript_71169/g.219632  ORF Transcript_71169/g.219632 Transcript_71169/m.219632 type:complete len:298 (-) Transcript_71169:227-1120(-)